jgi:thiaminase
MAAAISDSAIGRHVDEYEARSGRRLDLAAADASRVAVEYTEHLSASAAPDVPVAILYSILPGEQSYAAAGRYYGTAGVRTSENPYWSWIRRYASGHVDEIVAVLLTLIGRAPGAADGQGRRLLETYERSALLDAQFWAMVSAPPEG